MGGIDPRVLLEVAIAAVAVVGWFGLYGLCLLVTRPARVAPGPATQDLGAEPPAVVSLLAGEWDITEDAAESTLIDLAARRVLEFRQPGNDPRQTTIHIRDPRPAGLNPYERRIFDRVAGLAVAGVVPLSALTFREQDQAQGFARRLRADVIADARARGLSRRRFSGAVLTLLTVAAGAAGAVVTVAVLLQAAHANNHSDARAALGAGALTWIVLGAVAQRPVGERDTAAGRQAAARWLGLREFLRHTEAFTDLPPAAVAVWDRYLAYGDALGTARVCAAVIDLGMGNRKLVWSSFGGGWRRVRVHYPRWWPRYGKTAPRLLGKAALALVAGYVLVRYLGGAVATVARQSVVQGSPVAHLSGSVHLIGVVAGLVLLAFGLYAVVRTIIDLAAPATITGQVLWMQAWRTSGGQNNAPWLHYLAIDDGTGDTTKAWGAPTDLSRKCRDGDTVTITARRWSRRITAVTLVEQGARRAVDGGQATRQDTEALIAGTFAGAAPAGSPASLGMLGALLAAPAAAVPIESLVTADDASRAVGFAVTNRGTRAAMGPAQTAAFTGPDGSTVLAVVVFSGPAGRLAMHARRGGAPLPGVGDEAFAGPGWAYGRRGETLVGMQFRGAAAKTDPANVAWLLSTAVARIAATAGADASGTHSSGTHASMPVVGSPVGPGDTAGAPATA